MNTEIKTITINGVEYVEAGKQAAAAHELAENYKIFRCDRSGVFAGFEKSRSEDGKRGYITQARRLWYWSGAASLSQLAIDGTCKPNDCKFPEAVAEIELTDIIEVLSITKKAKQSIEGVKVWRQ